MRVWLAVSLAVVLWIVAGYYVVRMYQRQDRGIRRAEADQQVREMFDTPENIAQRVINEPHEPAPLIRYVWLAIEANEWEIAAERAALLAKRFPHLPQGRVLLTQIYWHKGEHDRSSAILRQVRRAFPTDGQILELSFRQAIFRKDWKTARRDALLVVKHLSTSSAGYSLLVELCLLHNDFEGAAAYLREAETELPYDPHVEKLWEKVEAAQTEAETPASPTPASPAHA